MSSHKATQGPQRASSLRTHGLLAVHLVLESTGIHASPGCPPGSQGRIVNLKTEEERREVRTLDLGSESRDGGLTSFSAEKVTSWVTLSTPLYLLHLRIAPLMKNDALFF